MAREVNTGGIAYSDGCENDGSTLASLPSQVVLGGGGGRERGHVQVLSMPSVIPATPECIALCCTIPLSGNLCQGPDII